MGHRRTGFTMLELLIVITIISIVASIAIPNLLRSRMAANETAAIGGMKAIATAQETFRRQSKDWVYPGHQLGVAEYANRFYLLHKISDSLIPAHIDESTARACITCPAPAARTGYWFCDVDFIKVDNRWLPVDHKVRYGIYGAPASYNMSGMQSYYVDSRGQIWRRDIPDGPLDYKMPNNPAEVMFAVNE